MSELLARHYRTAFVTGASTGLGRAFAAMLAADGVRVWGTSRDVARLAGLRVAPVALDLADGEEAVRAFERALEEAGGAFDLVINNAGYGVLAEFSAVDFTIWDAQIQEMLISTMRLTHRAYSNMRGRNCGCLVNVSSLAVEFPLPFQSGYNAAKAGLSALSESLIFESRGSAVTVIDFRPGDYRTAFNEAMRDHSSTTGLSPRTGRAWKTAEANLNAAPPPERAAADLRRALLRRQSGIVRSGSFFQARLAPLLARLVPASLVRAAAARYFGSL